MTYTVKKVAPEHLCDLALLEAECFREPWSESSLRLLLGDAATGYCICDENGSAVAYGSMLYAPDEGQILNIAVTSSHRRRGLGEQILKALLRDADAHRLSEVSLEVRSENTPAIRLYEKCGFRQAGIRKQFYKNPPDDALVMLRQMRTDA